MNITAQTTSARPSTPGRRHILFPHEHGAYGQLIFPALTALLLGTRLPGAGLAVAFALVFLLHEPVLVLLGHRGPRARQELGDMARRQCVLLCVATMIILGSLTPLLSTAAWWAMLLPVAAAAGIGIFIVRGKERTTAGELTAAAGLSACCVPIAVADGSRWTAALACWLIWAAVLMAATLAVRGVIARGKYGATRLARMAVLVGAGGMAVAALLLRNFTLPYILLAAAAPAVLLPLVLLWLKPSPKYLRAIGWSAMTVDFAIVVVLAAALR